ncbi:MAG: hypothetical protein R3F17_15090 [Planctomycetota bacterium]
MRRSKPAAEQYRHPEPKTQNIAETTGINIKTFRRPNAAAGLVVRLKREFATCDGPYRWTQWIFARLRDRGLAYGPEVPVWWCEA